MRGASAALAAIWGGTALATGVAVAYGIVGDKPWVEVAAAALLCLLPLTLGTLVARRTPGNATGLLLALAGLGQQLAFAPSDRSPGPFGGAWMLLYVPFAWLLLAVPEGHPESRRWAGVGWWLGGTVVAGNLLVAFAWAVPGAAATVDAALWVVLLPFMGLLIASVAAPIHRYRRADERDRLRLRWVFLTGSSLPLTLMLCWASYLVLGGPDLVVLGLLVMYLAIPAGVTIAMLRPNILDIDRAVVATMTAGVLSLAVLGILSVACAVVGAALIAWSPTAAIATTVGLTLAAALAYRGLRRLVDRAVYPERGRTLAALQQLAARVEAGQDRPESVEDVLRVALRDPGLRVAVAGHADGTLFTLDGTRIVPTALTAPVRSRGEVVGALVASDARVKRPGPDVAAAAAPFVEAARANAELASARSEVEASRERLARAGIEERRRLERDLHDGAQQRLVALGMRLRVLQRGAGADAATADAIDEAVAELGTAVAELRRLAHGVRPSALDDGLGAALAMLVRLAPDTIELEIHAPDVPDATSTTAYFVVSEAVTNALKHAEATRVRVAVHRAEEDLHVVVADDGRGGAGLRPTGGLTGISDRVAALGGTLTVTSPAGAGTRVEARLPCGS
ncbi:sensor histidine kinase [Demequina soli]|uniref:sensor histidine kinase n=1 Tax=Demequina soli TaxID=1638987 RepID=UPI000780C77B|nr:histidine kinase [Demequina soli]